MENKEKSPMAKKKRKNFIPLLWWSVLIHLALLIFVLFFAFKKSTVFIPIKKLSTKKTDIPAALKPRKSTFGTTVFFDDRAAFKPPKAPILGPKKLAGKEEKKPQPKLQVKKEIKSKFKEKVKEKIKPKIKKIAQKKFIPKEKPKTQIVQAKKEEIKKRIKEIEEKQKQLQQAQMTRAKLEQQISIPKMQKMKTVGVAQKNKSPIKRRKSIIAMTKGFVENLKDKGQDWLERKGDKNKRPSFEELKYISYEEKINWQLQSCWKQNFAHDPTQKVPEGKAVVDFQINENGSLQNINLLHSSGNQQLDNLILKSIQLAAPFPPLPKHFGKKIYKTGRIISVHSYRFRF